MSGIGWPTQGTVTEDGGLGWPMVDDDADLETDAPAVMPSSADPTGDRSAASEGAVWWEALHADDAPCGVEAGVEAAVLVDPGSTSFVSVPASPAAAVAAAPGPVAALPAPSRQVDVRAQEWGGPVAPTPALVGELRRQGQDGSSHEGGAVPSAFHVEPAPDVTPSEPGRWGRWRDSVDEAPRALFQGDAASSGEAAQNHSVSAADPENRVVGTTAKPEWVPDGSSAGAWSWREQGANAPTAAGAGALADGERAFSPVGTGHPAEPAAADAQGLTPDPEGVARPRLVDLLSGRGPEEPAAAPAGFTEADAPVASPVASGDEYGHAPEAPAGEVSRETVAPVDQPRDPVEVPGDVSVVLTGQDEKTPADDSPVMDRLDGDAPVEADAPVDRPADEIGQESLVSRETTGLTDEQEEVHAETGETSSDELPPLEDLGESVGAARPAPMGDPAPGDETAAIEADAAGDAVSRETDTPGPGAAADDIDGTVAPAWEDRAAGDGAEAEPVDMSHDPRGDAPAGQTAPAEPSHSEAPGPMDGSAGMDERAGDGGVLVAGAAPSGPQEQMSEYGHMTTTGSTPVRVGYEEHERVDLVRSLPSVDDSTPLAVEVAEDARRRITLSGRPFPKPPHTRIMTVANQKGGVGKTTTTVNMAAALAQAGLNVLVLDIDPQGNASTALGIDHHSDIPSLYDVVVEGMPLADVVQPCPDVPNLWCAPATIDLAGAEIELVSLVARETRLQRALATYLDERINAGLPNIDYVFVDCPPSLSLLTVNAFVAAREVLIPIQCEYYALEGLSQLLKHVELIRGHLNPELHVSTILLTMYDGRTRLSSQVADEVREHFPEQVVKTSVPRSVRISEAPSHGQTVMTYDPASSGALSYLEAARELAEQVLTWNDRPTTTEERV